MRAPTPRPKAPKVPRCAACKKRIPRSEPDLVLENLSRGRGPRYYHERCTPAACRKASERPGVYILTVRAVEVAAN